MPPKRIRKRKKRPGERREKRFRGGQWFCEDGTPSDANVFPDVYHLLGIVLDCRLAPAIRQTCKDLRGSPAKEILDVLAVIAVGPGISTFCRLLIRPEVLEAYKRFGYV